MKALAVLLSLLSGVLFTLAIFLWLAAGEIYDYHDTFSIDDGSMDVVLCLAGGKRRIPIAVELWQKLRAVYPQSKPTLFLSGVGPHTGFETLLEQDVPKETVEMMKAEQAKATKRRQDEIIFENVSENTYENAQIFSTFARQNHWKKVVLVTAGYHMRRAEFILLKALDPGVEIFTSTVDAVHFDRNEWHQDAYAIRVTLIEYIKWLYYRYSY